MRLKFLLIPLLAAGPGCRPRLVAAGACPLSSPLVATDSSIGPYIVGRPLPCRALRDTVELDPHEGLPRTVAYLPAVGDTIRSVLDSGRIFYLFVSTSSIRTGEGWGVGTPVTTLLAVPNLQVFEGAEAEPAYYLRTPSHCGISFQVVDTSAGFTANADPIARLRLLPPTARVSGYHIYGCRTG